MKKKLLIITLLLFLSMETAAAYTDESINVSINNKYVEFTNTKPFIDKNGRTLVPFRATLESFGATVDWDEKNNMAIATKEDIVIKIPIGENYILKNDEVIENDTKSINKNNSIYLPIRAVLEAFNANVNWNNDTKTVEVTKEEFKDTATVTFSNPVIEALIRDTLNKNDKVPITRSDLKTINKFDCADKNLGDISDLANLTELNYLSLQRCQIIDIRPLSSLKKITTLYLSENNINDTSPLEPLLNLEFLALDSNNITSIESLSGLNKLSDLRLDKNNINDISPLAQCINIESLSISDNNVVDISPLNNLAKLSDLRASNNNIADISCIKKWNNIRVFFINNNYVNNLTPLSEHMELESIRITGNLDTDYSKFNNHKKLKYTDFNFHVESPKKVE